LMFFCFLVRLIDAIKVYGLKQRGLGASSINIQSIVSLDITHLGLAWLLGNWDSLSRRSGMFRRRLGRWAAGLDPFTTSPLPYLYPFQHTLSQCPLTATHPIQTKWRFPRGNSTPEFPAFKKFPSISALPVLATLMPFQLVLVNHLGVLGERTTSPQYDGRLDGGFRQTIRENASTLNVRN
jgi:hypothetical protein